MPCAFPIKCGEQKLFLNILTKYIWECRIHDFKNKRYLKLNVSKSTQSNPTDYIKQSWYQVQKHFHGLNESLLNSVRYFFSIVDSPSWIKLLMYQRIWYLPIQISICKLPLNPTELKLLCQDREKQLSSPKIITIICLFVVFIRYTINLTLSSSSEIAMPANKTD